MRRDPRNRIDEALRIGRISRFRAWWERLVCPHFGAELTPVTCSDGIDAWREASYLCHRCGATGWVGDSGG